MANRNKWIGARYLNAETCKSGLMVCCSCGKKIVSGQYRCRETAAAYVTQHRACGPHDPVWAKLDGEQAEHDRKTEMMRTDALAFITKWGAVDLSYFLDGGNHGE